MAAAMVSAEVEQVMITAGSLDSHGKAYYGVPGPGRYSPPTTFGQDTRTRERVRLLSSAPAYSMASRAVPPEPFADSPGPKYLPNLGHSQPAGGRQGFGSSDREQDAKVFISRLHCAANLAQSTPGPGTYRVGVQARRRRPRHQWGGGVRFGRSPQREGVPREAAAVPGPVYDTTSSIEGGSKGATFGPKDLRKGLRRERLDNGRQFISKLHSEADHSYAAGDIPAAKYDVENVERLSPKRRAAAYSFPQRSRDSGPKEYISPAHTRMDCPQVTPGPVYDLPPVSGHTGPLFGGTGQRFASPELGPATAGAFISKAHSDASMKGNSSPGPAAYVAKDGNIGSGPHYAFGSGHLPFVTPTINPGPGTYHRLEQRQAIQSHDPTPPAYSLGLRTSLPRPALDTPGPGAYPTHHADTLDAQSTVHIKAPAYHFGQKTDLPSERPLDVPGPGAYARNGSVESEPGKGFTFGVRERCRGGDATNTTVRCQGALASGLGKGPVDTNVYPRATLGDPAVAPCCRYQGPLASSLDKGLDSPGPAAYCPKDSRFVPGTTLDAPCTRFAGSSTKAAAIDRSVPSKLFISKLHSTASSLCVDSPGPAAYQEDLRQGLVGTSNKFPNSGAFSFGCGGRPEVARVKF